MRIIYERCGGLDVHKSSITACVLIAVKGKIQQQIRRFGAMSADLKELADWLQGQGIRDVAMESTGVYWKPVWNVLEAAGMDLLLANAQQVKIVPGRKTDQNDSQWIADLHMHGLLRKSFVPPRPTRDLRDLTRTRTILVQQHTAVCNRIQKVLEDANIKLGSVASDVFGVSGRAMLLALIEDQKDPQAMADLAKGVLRKKIPQLRRALEGHVTAHHQALLRGHWQRMEFLEGEIAAQETAISQHTQTNAAQLPRCEDTAGQDAGESLSPQQYAIRLWMEIPGVGWTTACSMAAELGTDMDQFPSAAELASWAALCPGNNESAGKRFSGKTRKGNVWLRRTMCEAAWAASHTKDSYFSAQFRRIGARRGRKRALIAVAHSILVTAYCMLKHKRHYRELGGDFFDGIHRKQLCKRLLQRLTKLGFTVTLEETIALHDSSSAAAATDNSPVA